MTNAGINSDPIKIVDCVVDIGGSNFGVTAFTKFKVYLRNGVPIRFVHKDTVIWESDASSPQKTYWDGYLEATLGDKNPVKLIKG